MELEEDETKENKIISFNLISKKIQTNQKKKSIKKRKKEDKPKNLKLMIQQKRQRDFSTQNPLDLSHKIKINNQENNNNIQMNNINNINNNIQTNINETDSDDEYSGDEGSTNEGYRCNISGTISEKNYEEDNEEINYPFGNNMNLNNNANTPKNKNVFLHESDFDQNYFDYI